MSNGEVQTAQEQVVQIQKHNQKLVALASPTTTTEKAPETKPVANAVSVLNNKLRPLLLKNKRS